jgi:inner membrane transporter RhtA
VTPLACWAALPALADPVALAAGAGVGISSSVIPYVSDQLAMRRLARATYALMVSLLPATATVIGIVVLAQVPSPRELIGVALVVAGVAVHREADSHAAGPNRRRRRTTTRSGSRPGRGRSLRVLRHRRSRQASPR